MHARMRSVAIALLLSVSVPAGAQQLNRVALGDLPNTDGKWQMGTVTVSAPAEVVQRWFSDASTWQANFPDMEKVRIISRGVDTQVVEFKSNIVGRTLTVTTREVPGRITYNGTGSGVTTEGRIFIQSVAPDRTKVTLETTGEVHGAARLVISDESKRDRAIKKINSDLHAIIGLSNRWAAEQRHRG
jgi:hypothetical protein